MVSLLPDHPRGDAESNGWTGVSAEEIVGLLERVGAGEEFLLGWASDIVRDIAQQRPDLLLRAVNMLTYNELQAFRHRAGLQSSDGVAISANNLANRLHTADIWLTWALPALDEIEPPTLTGQLPDIRDSVFGRAVRHLLAGHLGVVIPELRVAPLPDDEPTAHQLAADENGRFYIGAIVRSLHAVINPVRQLLRWRADVSSGLMAGDLAVLNDAEEGEALREVAHVFAYAAGVSIVTWNYEAVPALLAAHVDSGTDDDFPTWMAGQFSGYSLSAPEKTWLRASVEALVAVAIKGDHASVGERIVADFVMRRLAAVADRTYRSMADVDRRLGLRDHLDAVAASARGHGQLPTLRARPADGAACGPSVERAINDFAALLGSAPVHDGADMHDHEAVPPEALGYLVRGRREELPVSGPRGHQLVWEWVAGSDSPSGAVSAHGRAVMLFDTYDNGGAHGQLVVNWHGAVLVIDSTETPAVRPFVPSESGLNVVASQAIRFQLAPDGPSRPWQLRPIDRIEDDADADPARRMWASAGKMPEILGRSGRETDRLEVVGAETATVDRVEAARRVLWSLAGTDVVPTGCPERDRFLHWLEHRGDSAMSVRDYLTMHRLEPEQVRDWLEDPSVLDAEGAAFPVPARDSTESPAAQRQTWLRNVGDYLGLAPQQIDDLIGAPSGTWLGGDLTTAQIRALLRRVPAARDHYRACADLGFALMDGGRPAYPEGYFLDRGFRGDLYRKYLRDKGSARRAGIDQVTEDEIAECAGKPGHGIELMPSARAVSSFADYLRYWARVNGAKLSEAARFFGLSVPTAGRYWRRELRMPSQALFADVYEHVLYRLGTMRDVIADWTPAAVLPDPADFLDPEDQYAINRWLGACRVALRRTQQEFAGRRSTATVLRIEGFTLRPSAEMIRDLCRENGIPDDLARRALTVLRNGEGLVLYDPDGALAPRPDDFDQADPYAVNRWLQAYRTYLGRSTRVFAGGHSAMTITRIETMTTLPSAELVLDLCRHNEIPDALAAMALGLLRHGEALADRDPERRFVPQTPPFRAVRSASGATMAAGISPLPGLHPGGILPRPRPGSRFLDRIGIPRSAECRVCYRTVPGE